MPENVIAFVFNYTVFRREVLFRIMLFQDVVLDLNICEKLKLSRNDPRVEAGKNTSTVIPASRQRRRKGNRISLR
jgi:hypothetical protein